MISTTKQIKNWTGEFGKKYTERNLRTIEEKDKRYIELIGVKRSEINNEFIGDLDRSSSILEVGSNVGDQLLFLKKMGFNNIKGIEVQDGAIRLARKRFPGLNIIQASALDIPFEDGAFDLVFTSVVLIHIAPSDIKTVLREIHRCSRRYIWGYEYYNDTYTEVNYRGQNDLLWKSDFCKLYLDEFDDLLLVKENKIKYINNDNIDSMFLLEKIK